MTAAEGWTEAVRARLRPGRLLPLGTPEDGAWLAEQAAEKVLRQAAMRVPGVVPGLIRVGLADPGRAGAPTVPPPPAALPPGPLRIEAEFAAVGAVPLAEPAGLLRRALFAAAGERLGLRVAAVDLRITALLDVPPEPDGERTPADAGTPPVAGPAAAGPRNAGTDDTGTDRAGTDDTGTDRAGTDDTDRDDTDRDGARAIDRGRQPRQAAATEPDGTEGTGDRLPGAHPGAGSMTPAGAVAAAAAAVPGVARLTGTLGTALWADEPSVRVECATAPGHRPVEVARAVRAAVVSVLPSPLPVTVLVMEVGLGE